MNRTAILEATHVTVSDGKLGAIKVEPAELKELMRRHDARPLRDFALYFLLLAGLACLTMAL